MSSISPGEHDIEAAGHIYREPGEHAWYSLFSSFLRFIYRVFRLSAARVFYFDKRERNNLFAIRLKGV